MTQKKRGLLPVEMLNTEEIGSLGRTIDVAPGIGGSLRADQFILNGTTISKMGILTSKVFLLLRFSMV